MSARRQTLPTGPRTTMPEPVEPPIRPVGVQLRARGSTRLIVIGILCVCLGSLAAAWAWNAGQESQPVVLLAADVARGEQIEASDLTTTNLGCAAGVAVIPADQASTLIGQYAQTDLQAGSLIGPAAIGAQAVPPGFSHVGLRLAAGRLPSRSMPAGAAVVLVAVPGQMDEDQGAGAEFEAVLVSAAQPAVDSNFFLVDVEVSETVAGTVAALAAQERIALIRKAEG